MNILLFFLFGNAFATSSSGSAVNDHNPKHPFYSNNPIDQKEKAPPSHPDKETHSHLHNAHSNDSTPDAPLENHLKNEQVSKNNIADSSASLQTSSDTNHSGKENFAIPIPESEVRSLHKENTTPHPEGVSGHSYSHSPAKNPVEQKTPDASSQATKNSIHNSLNILSPHHPEKPKTHSEENNNKDSLHSLENKNLIEQKYISQSVILSLSPSNWVLPKEKHLEMSRSMTLPEKETKKLDPQEPIVLLPEVLENINPQKETFSALLEKNNLSLGTVNNLAQIGQIYRILLETNGIPADINSFLTLMQSWDNQEELKKVLIPLFIKNLEPYMRLKKIETGAIKKQLCAIMLASMASFTKDKKEEPEAQEMVLLKSIEEGLNMLGCQALMNDLQEGLTLLSKKGAKKTIKLQDFLNLKKVLNKTNNTFSVDSFSSSARSSYGRSSSYSGGTNRSFSSSPMSFSLDQDQGVFAEYVNKQGQKNASGKKGAPASLPSPSSKKTSPSSTPQLKTVEKQAPMPSTKARKEAPAKPQPLKKSAKNQTRTGVQKPYGQESNLLNPNPSYINLVLQNMMNPCTNHGSELKLSFASLLTDSCKKMGFNELVNLDIKNIAPPFACLTTGSCNNLPFSNLMNR